MTPTNVCGTSEMKFSITPEKRRPRSLGNSLVCILGLVVTLFQFFQSVSSGGFLNIEDLKYSQFHISIQSKPVLLNSQFDETVTDKEKQVDLENYAPDDAPSSDVESLVLSSKYGQLYQCSLPKLSTEDSRDEKLEKEKAGDVQRLLGPMKDGPCLFYTKGWWSYEFCYGKEVKQYHFENGAISGNTLLLGLYDYDYNWTKTLEGEKERETKVSRNYHSQYYVNGSKCDLTGELRKSEVRFKCDESLSGKDMELVTGIEEPSTCTYLFIVSTVRLCSHPRFKSDKPLKPKPISCSPALSKHEFEKYTKLQERTSQRVKEMGERLRNLNSLYEKRKKERTTKQEPTSEEPLPLGPKSADSNLTPSMEKLYKEVYSTENQRGETDADSETDTDGPDTDAETETSKVGTEKEANEAEKMEGDEDPDEDDFQEFQKEAEGLTQKVAESAKHNFASILKGQFNDIYEEAKEELVKETGQDFEGDGDTQNAALDTLTKTLTKLLDQLDKTEKQLDSTGKGLKEAVEGKQEKWWQKHEETSQEMRSETEGEAKKEEGKRLEEWIKKTIEKEEDKNEKGTDGTKKEENLVKVRISKLAKSKTNSDSKGVKPISIEEKDQEQLSKAVQEELEKAGLLDTQGRKVEVRIVTSGFFEDNDEDGVHTLTQADSTQFRSLVANLLGANSQQISEEYRKTQMKSNYKYVWKDEEVESTIPTHDVTTESSTDDVTSDAAADVVATDSEVKDDPVAAPEGEDVVTQ